MQTIKSVRADFARRGKSLRHLSDAQIQELINERWPLPVESDGPADIVDTVDGVQVVTGLYLPLGDGPREPAYVAAALARLNRPRPGSSTFTGRREGEPEPEWLPAEAYRERLGMAFGYLDTYGPRPRARRMGDDPPTYGSG